MRMMVMMRMRMMTMRMTMMIMIRVGGSRVGPNDVLKSRLPPVVEKRR